MFLDGLAFAIQIAVCCKEEFYGGHYWVQAINPEDKGVQVILGKRGPVFCSFAFKLVKRTNSWE